MKVRKKVPKRVFPKVQVPFSDFSKVPKKVRTKNQSSKVPKKIPEKVRKIVGKKREMLSPNYFETFSGTFFGTFELWFLVRAFFGTLEKSENGT